MEWNINEPEGMRQAQLWFQNYTSILADGAIWLIPPTERTNLKTIIRAKGGSRERVVEVNDIKIPDLWALVHNHDMDLTPKQRAAVLECWHLTHDLLRAVKETP